MFRKFLNVALVLSLTLSVTVFGQQPSTTPSLDRLRKDVTHLASDNLDGRRTGTKGANDAARYIAGEFSLLGLRPGMQTPKAARARGGTRARYLQPFPYVSNVELGKNNSFVMKGAGADYVRFTVGEDWMPLGFSSNGDLKTAEVVFAGYGISSSALKYDDYAVSNVKDRVAVVFAGTPDGDNPHGQFVQAGQVRFKAAAARAAGARALLIISKEELLKDDRMSRISYDNAGEAGIPVAVISRKLATSLFGNLSDYEKGADVRTLDSNLGIKDAASPEADALVKPMTMRLPPGGVSVTLRTEVIRRQAPSHNVIGILPGSDPKLKDEAIVIGAHYDHLGRGGQGSLAQREGEIHHGADDNASGTSALIELARMFSSAEAKAAAHDCLHRVQRRRGRADRLELLRQSSGGAGTEHSGDD